MTRSPMPWEAQESQIELQNILTLEQRLSMVRLLQHDAISILTKIYCMEEAVKSDQKSSKELNTALPEHIRNIMGAVDALTQNNQIRIPDHCLNNWFNKSNLDNFLRVMQETLFAKHKNRLTIAPYNLKKEFGAHHDIFYAMLYNLAKNALQHHAPNARLEIDFVSNLPEKVLFVPNGAEEYKEFTRFCLSNTGEFPKTNPLGDYLNWTSPPQVGGRGFGLYFAGLAGKLLRIPMHIVSENNKTDISVYHPIYSAA